MNKGSTPPDLSARVRSWVTAHEVTWYLMLAASLVFFVTGITVVGSGRPLAAAVGEGVLYGVPFAFVYYLFDRATGTTRWPDSE